jgi:hypothetical protein
MSPAIANTLLTAMLVPYLWLAWRDNLLHMNARKVPKLEHVTHVGVVVALVVLISAVFMRDVERALLGAALFVPPAVADEMIFHRDIPAEEHDVHAKQHLMLFVFTIAAALVFANERSA